jgi:hypothetical protein
VDQNAFAERLRHAAGPKLFWKGVRRDSPSTSVPNLGEIPGARISQFAADSFRFVLQLTRFVNDAAAQPSDRHGLMNRTTNGFDADRRRFECRISVAWPRPSGFG